VWLTRILRGRPIRRRDGNIKMDGEKIGMGLVCCRIKYTASFCKKRWRIFGSLKSKNFLHKLLNSQRVKRSGLQRKVLDIQDLKFLLKCMLITLIFKSWPYRSKCCILWVRWHKSEISNRMQELYSVRRYSFIWWCKNNQWTKMKTSVWNISISCSTYLPSTLSR